MSRTDRLWSRFVYNIKEAGSRLAWYPFLFALYAVLGSLVNNLDALDPAQALRPLALLLAGTAASLLIFRALVKDWRYAAYLVFLALAFYFIFGHLNRTIQDALPVSPRWAGLAILAAWSILFVILGLRRTWRRFGGATGRLTPLLNLVLLSALLVQLATSLDELSGYLARPLTSAERAALPITGDPVPLDCSASPDIYYIILDGYGRADVLEALYGLDNSGFLEFLEERGFYVAEQSSANYIQTALSIPSALNFDYLYPEPNGVSGRDFFTELIADNRLVGALEKCGYHTFALETGFPFTDQMDVDARITRGSSLTDLEDLLLAGTPLDVINAYFEKRPAEFGYPAHRQRVLFSFEQLAQFPRKPGSKFIFAHIVSPHPPFVFDAQGLPVDPLRSYTLGDGDDYRGSREEYLRGYAAQVQFVNRQVEAVIDTILSNSRTPPVIVIQGDHGPGSSLDWDTPDRTCLWERTSILNAYYLPGRTAEALYPSISPVNTFRLILNLYFDAGLDLLPDRTYYTSHRLPRRFIEITARRDSTQNCSRPASRTP